ncbi:hypothetical protein SORBI_3001G410450 [Sorghum bicolor]|jgi:hypothetical protein|uniref:Uncharacterized protein n=1 Tax=Sorghum bicolor TaxID=4558 RepID=A0A1Z5SA30_SORBI|nr:hypothetical protein SORBI_3001G410450 [Sorghum bicolor]
MDGQRKKPHGNPNIRRGSIIKEIVKDLIGGGTKNPGGDGGDGGNVGDSNGKRGSGDSAGAAADASG